MGDITLAAKNELLDHIFNAAYSPPANVYLCLCTADPTENATNGATINEYPNTHGYARTEITFGAAATRSVTQDADVNFPAATGNYSAAITHWAICDSATHNGGNCLAFGAFSSSFQPVTDNTPIVANGECIITIQATAAGAGFTNLAVQKMLDLMFNNTAWSAPDTYIAVLLATASDATLESGITEESGSGYSRVQVNPNGGASPTWDLATGGAVDNGAVITIGPPTADDWGQLVALGLVTAATGGDLLAYDNSNVVDQTPTSADTVRLTAGNCSFTLT